MRPILPRTQYCRFVTGHSRKGVLPDNLDWGGLSDLATTSVYYMSRRTLPKIVTQLTARHVRLSATVVDMPPPGR